MSSIDLVILGIVSERAQSAYDVAKDVVGRHYDKWTRVSVSSVYKKMLSLKEQGYLSSVRKQGDRVYQDIYSITPEGVSYFQALMDECAQSPVLFPLELNLVITNLNKVTPPREKKRLLCKVRLSIVSALEANRRDARLCGDLPYAGRTIFEQQRQLYESLLSWLDQFEKTYAPDSDRTV